MSDKPTEAEVLEDAVRCALHPILNTCAVKIRVTEHDGLWLEVKGRTTGDNVRELLK